MSAIFLFVALSPYVSFVYAAAGINQTINFQGKLVGSNGLNVADGNYDVVFKLFDDPTAGSELWTETWNSGTSQVPVTDGIFRVALGTHATMSSVDFNQDAIYLSVKVGADAAMTPRIRFTSVPYAFVAKTVVDDALDFAQFQDALDLDASTSITADGTEVLSIVNTGTGNSFLVEDVASDTTPFVIDASGNVGIGVAAPGQKLAVAGNIDLNVNGSPTIGNNTFGANTITFANTGVITITAPNAVTTVGSTQSSGSADQVSFSVAGTITKSGTTGYTGLLIAPTLSTLGSGGNYLFDAQGSGSSRVVITTAGDVGVGTTAPVAKMHVDGQCVALGTKIRRRRRKKKNGEYEEDEIPVEDIQPSDEVLSLNEETGEFEWQLVEQTMDKGIQETFELMTESGKKIETTSNHPYLVLPMGKESASFSFVDEIGVFENNKLMLFGVGALTVKNNLFEINQKLHQIFVEAVTFYDESEAKFELKFKYITPRNLIFYNRFIDVLGEHADDWDFEFIFEKRNQENFWRHYITLIKNIFEQKDGRYIVLADYLNKPKKVSASFDDLIALESVANAHQLESQGSLLLQASDILLGAISFIKNNAKDQYKKEVARKVRDIFEQKNRAGVDSIYAALGVIVSENNNLSSMAETAPSASDLLRDKKRVGVDPIYAAPKLNIPKNSGLSNAGTWPAVYPSETRGTWTKVSEIKEGQKIATVDGFEKVVSIKRIGRKQTYDLQIAHTHNFVANDIVAHNTYLRGLDQLNTSFALRIADSTSADKLVVTNAGNVGIGTTSPLNKLHILGAGTQNFSGGQANSYLVVEGTNQTGANANVSIQTNTAQGANIGGTLGLGGLYRAATTDPLNYAILRGAKENSTDTAFGGYFSISTYVAGGTVTEKMRITGDGNLGIGTTSPGQKLDVAGNISLSSGGYIYGDTTNPYLRLNQTYGTYLGYSTNSVLSLLGSITDLTAGSTMTLGTNGSTRVTIDSSGNVGIGTTNPGSKLSVYGGLVVGSSYSTSDAGDNNILLGGNLTFNGASTHYIQVGSNPAPLTFRMWDGAQNVDAVTIKNDGNVGIGDTTPLSLLTVGSGDLFQVNGSGAIAAVVGITNTGVITSTGGIVNLNASSNYAVNIGTGTTTSTVTLGGGSNNVVIDSSVWDITGAGVASGLTGITSSGTITLSGLSNDGAEATGVLINGSNQLVTREFAATAFTGTATAMKWNALTDPDGALTLAHGTNATTFGWTPTAALDAFTMNIVNNGGSSTTQNGLVINNAVAGSFTDTATDNLLLVQQLDTTAAGTTVVTNAIKVDVAAASGMTNGLLVTNSAGNLTTGINITDTGGGTITTGIALSGTFTTGVDMGNAIIANIGNANTDFNTNGGLTLAENLVIQGTTGLTFNTGAGGDITFANLEKIDNDTDGILTLTSPSVVASAALTVTTDLTVSGGDITGVTGESIDLGEATADTLTFTVGGAAELILNGTTLAPNAAEGLSLGSAAAEYEELFLGDQAGAKFGLDQDWNLFYEETTTDNLQADAASVTSAFQIIDGNLRVGNGTPGTTLDGEDAYIEGTLEVDGTVRLDGVSNDGAEATALLINGSNQVVYRELGTAAFTASTAYANTALSNLASVAINTSLISDAADTDDLGSATYEWNSLYLSDGSGLTAGGGLFFGNDQDILLTYDEATSDALELSDGTTTFLSIKDQGTAADIAFNTDDLFVKSDGNVGIGTTNPAVKLQIAGADTDVLALGSSTTEGGDISIYEDTSGNKSLAFNTDEGLLTVKRTAANDWVQANTDGYGSANTTTTTKLLQFNDKFYSFTNNNTNGARIFVSSNGTSWSQVSTDGLGDTNNKNIKAAKEFDGYLYIGTANTTTGTEIWRSKDGATWAQVNADGFGSALTTETISMDVYNGYLYASAFNGTTYGKLYRTKDGSSWSTITSNGFGDTGTYQFDDFAIYKGALYTSTHGGAVKIWKSTDGTNFTQVNTNGFGDGSTYAAQLEVFRGNLYAGTAGGAGGAQVWSTADGSNWTQVNTNGFDASGTANYDAFAMLTFNNYLYVGVSNSSTGTEMWRTTDGSTWAQVNSNGFGSASNNYAPALASYKGYIYSGTNNSSVGTRLYRMHTSIIENTSGSLFAQGLYLDEISIIDGKINGVGQLQAQDITTTELGVTNGASIGATFAADSTFTNSALRLDFSTPVDTTGTNTHQALSIASSIGNASGGTNTANLINIDALSGDAQVSLNALKVGNLTGTAATEYALNIGTGWDAELRFADTSPVVSIADTGSLTFTDGSNTLLTLADAGTTGNLTISGDATISGADITGANSESINIGSTDGQFLLKRNDAGGVTLTVNDNDTATSFVIKPGDGGGGLTLGSAATSQIQLITDVGLGNSGVVLPSDAIGPNEIFTTGQTDEYCLTYEATGTTWAWQACGGGAQTLQTTYDADADGSDALITLNATDGNLIVKPIAGTNFQVAQVTSAPTTDIMAITNAALGAVTDGVDGLSINFVTGDGTNFTNSGLNLALTSGGTGAGDILNGIDLSLSGTSGTERGINIGSGFDTGINIANAIGSQAIAIANTSGIRTTATIDINEDNTTGSVPTIQWDSAETRGGFLDANLSGALGTENFIDLTTSGAFTSNLIDVNIGAQAATGDVINIGLGATAVNSQALVVTNTASIRTASMIQVDDNNTTGTVATFDLNGAGTRGGLFDIDWSGALTTESLIDVTADSIASGTLFDMTANGLTTGKMINLDSTSTVLTTGNMFNLDWSPSGSTEIFATGDLFKINVGQYGNVGNIFALYDNTTELFSVDQSKITSALPHEFTAAGDVSFAYDAIFTNQTASTIESYGPLTITSGESFENLDLTLKAYGTGSVVIDGSDVKLATGQKLILDSDDSADSYFVHSNANNYVQAYADNVEVVRFNSDQTVDGNSTFDINAFDVAEYYPTMNNDVEAGDLVSLTASNDSALSKYLVDKTSIETSEQVLGIVSTNPAFTMGGGSFRSDFCELVTTDEGKARQSLVTKEQQDVVRNDLEEKGVVVNNAMLTSEPINTIVSDVQLTSSQESAIEDKIASCKAIQQVPIALSGRVPVKVDYSNGNIKIGDYLSASAISLGKAVRAVGDVAIIGRALEDGAPGQDTVMVFVSATSARNRVPIQDLLAGQSVRVKDLTTDTIYASQLVMNGYSFAKDSDIATLSESINSLARDIQNVKAAVARDQNDISDLKGLVASASARIESFDAQLAGWQDVLGTDSASLLQTYASSSAKVATVSGLMVEGKATTFDLVVLNAIEAGLINIGGADGTTIDSIGDLSIQSLAQGGITFMGGKIKFDTSGNIITVGDIKSKSIDTGAISVSTDAGSDSTLGHAVLPASTQTVTIPNTNVHANSSIFITATSQTGNKPLYIKQKSEGSFVVAIDAAIATPITFDYFIIQGE